METFFIPQFIPQEICLKCEVCCRFIDEFSPWAPFILKGEIDKYKCYKFLPSFINSYGINLRGIKNRNFYVCPFFNSNQKKCLIYNERPLDCRLYPFVLFYNEDYTEVHLGIDLQCPYLRDKDMNIFLNFAKRLKSILENEENFETVYQNPGLIMDYNTNFFTFGILDKISSKIFGKETNLKMISLKDKELFNKFLTEDGKNFSYAFEYLYSWRNIAYLLWEVVDNNLLVFCKQGESSFLILPPLGKTISPQAINFGKSFLGKNMRIDNVTVHYSDFFKQNNFKLKCVNLEYIYESLKIAELKGDGFKSQRCAYNYFHKNYPAKIRELTSKDGSECLKLYELWTGDRLKKYKSEHYRLLIEDNFFAQRRLLSDYELLDLEGIVLEIGGEIKGYSFGYPLDQDNFCIFAEVVDFRFKGIAQYMFSEFCRRLKNFKFINTMDDSGLENIRKTKLSYRPSITRKFYSYEQLDY
ncbi:MAG: phosphatidylglycerol lysyltransferase domain-containing protein [Candidatus Omnitrophica bacterium]|nr:phosphatidylglycerol lysyltransferase domain-containing protein [Candidatus Omnitrophota bacterium]